MTFHPDDFRPSIDDMCDAVLRRLEQIREGGLSVMTASLMFGPADDAWELFYEARQRIVRTPS